MIPPFRREFDAALDPSTAHFALGLGSIAPWTPTLTFATPGDLSVVYSARVGKYTKIGRLVIVWFNIATSTFTFTTASGILHITGLPFTADTSNSTQAVGGLDWGGITKAGYTQISTEVIATTTRIQLIANASGAVRSFVAAADTPTTSSIVLRGSAAYFI